MIKDGVEYTSKAILARNAYRVNAAASGWEHQDAFWACAHRHKIDAAFLFASIVSFPAHSQAADAMPTEDGPEFVQYSCFEAGQHQAWQAQRIFELISWNNSALG
jgi:hypothetical protein